VRARDAGSGATRWSARFPGRAGLVYGASPALTDGALVAPAGYSTGSDGGSLVAFDATTGEVAWNRSLGDQPTGSVAAAGGVVYVGSEGGRVYAVDAGTGAVRWNASAGAPVRGGPAVANETVYVAGDALRALDAGTGGTQWTAPVSPSGTPAVADGTVYAVAGRDLVAVDAATGERRWRVDLPHEGVGPPVVAADHVYVATSVRFRQTAVVALDRETGQRRWRTTVPEYARTPLAAAGDRLYLATSSGSVLELGTADGARVRNWTVTDGRPVLSPAVADGVVAVRSAGGVRVVGARGEGRGVRVELVPRTRFPGPNDAVWVEARPTADARSFTYRWLVDGAPVEDCAGSDACYLSPFEYDYPMNVTVVATRDDGSVVRNSTVVRASRLSLDRRVDGVGRVAPEVLASRPLTLAPNRSLIQHRVAGVDWRVDGPARVAGRSGPGNATLSFTGEGRVRVNATVTLADQASGATNEQTAVSRLLAVRVRGRLPHHTFENETAVETYDDRTAYAELGYRLRRSYDELGDRTRGLPDPVHVVVGGVGDRCGDVGVAGCAEPPRTVVVPPDAPAELVRHEHVHVAQFRADGYAPGDYWAFFSEGQAEYESSYRYPFDGEARKPSKAEMRAWDGEYDDAHRFVAAFYARYGRQAALDLTADSRGESFPAAFEDATGESFDSFYDRWRPGDPDAGPNAVRTGESGIRMKPMAAHGAARLVALNRSEPLRRAARLGYDWRFPSDLRVEWDVDGDGTFERTGRRVAWSPAAGEHEVTVRYVRGNRSVSTTQVVAVEPGGMTLTASHRPAPATRGDEVAVTATLAAAGETVDRTLTLTVDDRRVDSRAVTVAAGANRSVAFGVATANLTAGNHTYRVEAGAATATGTLVVQPPGAFDEPLPGEAYVPKDPDDDGLYEDVDGDGTATFDDAVTLAFVDGGSLSPDRMAALDFDGDGDVDFDDAVTLAFAV
jgi:outer membrane protein assembly factor BamB